MIGKVDEMSDGLLAKVNTAHRSRTVSYLKDGRKKKCTLISCGEKLAAWCSALFKNSLERKFGKGFTHESI